MPEKKDMSKNECELGGDSNNCEDCAYYPDYKFDKETGECRINKN